MIAGDGRQRGFTLLEMMIALALLSLMLVVLFGGLRLGARSWDAAEAKLGRVGDCLLIQDFIRRQLQQAKPVLRNSQDKRVEIAFEGDFERLSFIAPLPIRRGQGGLYSFSLAVDEDEQLTIRYYPFDETADEIPDESKIDQEILLDNVAEITFEYFGTVDDTSQTRSWQDRWQDRQTLPMLVRLNLETTDTINKWPEMVVKLRLSDSTQRIISF